MPKSKTRRPGKGAKDMRKPVTKPSFGPGHLRRPDTFSDAPARRLSKRPHRFPGRTGGR